MDRQSPVYLDHHATTPVDPRVLDAMLPFFSQRWGNAASKDHRYGADAHEAVEEARVTIAREVGAHPDEIIFTSGATESNNLAITGLPRRAEDTAHVVTTTIEHRAVLDCLEALEVDRVEVTRVPVDKDGLVDPGAVAAAVRKNTVLISVMMANNEVGTIQPIEEIGAVAKAAGVLLHTDAAQALGSLKVDVKAAGVALLSGSAHKFYGPKGVGFLYASKRSPRVRLQPQIRGGGHERGVRSGTLNVPGIVGMAEALKIAADSRAYEVERLRKLTAYMEACLRERLAGVHVHGHRHRRLSHNLNVSFEGVRSKALVVNLPDLAFSTGSACTTQKAQPSHVLKAMGVGDDRLREAVRFGLGRQTTHEDVDYAVDRLVEVVDRMRSATSARTSSGGSAVTTNR